ncbi:Piwi domain-containing protein [Tundrisphaera lichenicola]|uniref:Piwi domain-containing protein n=1 Tax=Tundrisphaera lichenicola TaxID=2029860 RepID=UPI003EBCC575
MNDDYQIHLNFLPVIGELPSFGIFRKAREGSDRRPDEDSASYSFASGNDRDVRASYWVRTSPADGYEKYVARADENNNLTRYALHHALLKSVKAVLHEDQYVVRDRGFLNEIHLVMKHHPEGEEHLVIQPYHLRELGQFGCLVDFQFRKNDEFPFSRRIQQLSLSLDRQFKRNLDCYIDRLEKIRAFVKERAGIFTGLRLPGSATPFSLSKEFAPLPARRLRSKSYIFGNGRESRSQFSGLRDHGPLLPLKAAPSLLFLFREQDRVAARTLAMALKGTKGKERYSFPGFGSLFKTELHIDGDPIILPDLSEASMAAALVKVQAKRANMPGMLPVMVLPEGDDNGYLAHKADFAHAGIPTQVCTLRVIQDEYALKWAIANIALQIFCKAGGQPWKVRPTTEPTLIVGISQSHKTKYVEGKKSIEKYFAFSVMTDNSGLFQRIQVLGEGGSKSEYLRQLRANLQAVLAEGSEQFARVVVHTSFKLKFDEIDAIQETVSEAARRGDGQRCRFAVVKVNQKCRFFGVNRHVNSLVPYEGTAVKLGHHEHLVWFEGIFPDKTTVSKAFPGPTHLQFMRISDGAGISDDDLLQDIINLSGANWRGFNAKSAPVSVFYCHLVADLVHDFHDNGLPLPQVQVIRPWFL